MSESEAWTISRLLSWTTDYLKKQGADSPRLDAEVLLSHARGCQRIELYTAFDQQVDDEVRSAFRELVRRRASGEPVAYLVGFREFYSLPFKVTRDVLIPRPETEDLVVAALDRLRAFDIEQPRVVDVGTGSGAIAICVAKHAPNCQVTAIDISNAALDIAQANAQQHEVTDRVEFLSSDLLEALPAEPHLHLVVSNPPYVTQSEWEQLSVEVRDHEPSLALVGGETGVEIIARLIPQAAERLMGGGWLLMEISPTIASQVSERLQQEARFEMVQVRKDLAGYARIVQARRSSG